MCILFHAISFIRQALFSLTTHGKEGNFIASKCTSLGKVLILAGLGTHERCTLAVVVSVYPCHLDQRWLRISPALGKHCYMKLNPL